MFFYGGDRPEPIHVHVTREDAVAKFWLEPVRLAPNARLAPNEPEGYLDARLRLMMNGSRFKSPRKFRRSTNEPLLLNS